MNMVLDDYDGQIITGYQRGRSFLIFDLWLRKTPEKTSTRRPEIAYGPAGYQRRYPSTTAVVVLNVAKYIAAVGLCELNIKQENPLNLIILFL